MSVLALFVIALAVTMVLVPALARAARHFNVLDQPAGRKQHERATPRVGGIAMIVGVALPMTLALRDVAPVRGFLVATAILLVFGVWDDVAELRWPIKLAGQVLAVLAVMHIGGVRIGSWTPEVREPLAAWLSWPLSFFFLLGVTNAINLADGLDGLAGGTTLLCFCALALLAYVSGNLVPCALSIAMIGAILGFLRFNTHPARVFMGDSGSQFLGLGVGAAAILVTQEAQSPVSAALPLLLLGLPILDTLLVMAQRILERRSPFAADRNHIHHKLLALGFEHHEAVVAIYVLQCLLFLVAYFVRFESDRLILTLFTAFAVIVVGVLHLAAARGWRRHRASAASKDSWIVRQVHWLRQPEQLPRWSLSFIALGVPSYCLAVIGRGAAGSLDRPLLALILVAMSLVLIAWIARRDFGWLERGAAYFAATLVVYLDQTSGAGHGQGTLVFFGALAGAVAARFRLANDRRFEVTPLDVIVLFIALVVPNLPGAIALPPGLALGIAKILVLFYAIEMALVVRPRWNLSRAVVTTVLAALALRAFIPTS